MKLVATDQQRLESIISLLGAEGVQEAAEPKPLPSLSRSEVRLVTWMAVAKA